MSEELPAPLVAEHVDISKLDGFMLDTRRLLGSELLALASPEEFRAAVVLWCRAWQQTPPASLPDDDRILASFAMVDPKRWPKIRKMALRGFVTCSDGRLYHRVLAADVVRAWDALVRRHDRTKAATEARKTERNDQRNDQRNDPTSRSAERQRNEVPRAMPATGQDRTGQEEESKQAAAPGLGPRDGPTPDALVLAGNRLLAALGLDPMKFTGDFSHLAGWMAAGCDLDRDILPAVVQVAARPGFNGFKSLKYFTDAVMEAKAGRLSGRPPPGQAKPMSDVMRQLAAFERARP